MGCGWWLIVALIACKSELPNSQKAMCMGHGGMGIESTKPLNCKASILECLQLGADGVEIDIQLSADSVLYAFHDADLSKKTNGTGSIHSRTSHEINQLQYTGIFAGNNAIAQLDSIFIWLNEFPQAALTLDIKLYTQSPFTPYLQNFANSLNRLLLIRAGNRLVSIESQDTSFLNTMKQFSNKHPLYFYANEFEQGWQVLNEFDYQGLTMDFENITASEIEKLHSSNYKITVWNVQTATQNNKALDLQPDCIQTDELKDLLKKIKS